MNVSTTVKPFTPGSVQRRARRRRSLILLLVVVAAVVVLAFALHPPGSVTQALGGSPNGITVTTAAGSRTGQPLDAAGFAGGSCVVFGPTSGN
ncbi:MAG TPA: hypothetical protein VKY26_00660, partial [Actinomycetota bacterium]|nr:hypothetical protein [Actinomycetota bacterium]